MVPTAALFLCAASSAQAPSERVAQATSVRGVVFHDQDGDGVRDPGEPGLPGVMVSDQVQVVTTDAEGGFELRARGYGLVVVTQPNGFRAVGSTWRTVAGETADLAFPLASTASPSSFSFVHASDPHIAEASLPRMRAFRAMVDSLQPDFVLITGDLVRDALRVPESEARAYYELLMEELGAMSVPVHTVPGNHEKFGIERDRSGVATDHPLYGNRMYRHYLGPNYYAFSYGGVVFLGLDSVDYEDQSYHGHIDSLQVGWIGQTLDHLPADVRVVTFNHIPFVSGGEMRRGYRDDGLAPSVIRVDGTRHYRHTVYNHEEVLSLVGGRLEMALGGHIHMREAIRYQTQAGEQRLQQAAAIVGPAPGEMAEYGPLSGVTLYRVENGRLDDGTFLPLDPVPGR